MKNVCSACNKKYDLLPQNCVVYVYKNPTFCVIDTTCPGCDTVENMYCYRNYEGIIAGAHKSRIPIMDIQETPKEILARFYKVFPDAKGETLTSFQESEVKFFAYLLSKGEEPGWMKDA